MGDDIYQDAEAMSYNDKEITFPIIVLRHLGKILLLSTREWKGGYTNTDRFGNEVYISDTRAEYWNAVNVLADLLLPHFDDEMTKDERDHNKNEKILFNKWYLWKDGLPFPRTEGTDEKYKDEKVIIKRELFRALSKFLKRKSYFKGEAIEEMVE